MKKLITLFILSAILVLTFLYKDTIVTYILNEYIYRYANVKQKPNAYKIDMDISFVKETDNFFPKNKQDILNIFYTSLNNGVDSFIYYCTEEYENCVQDSEALAKDDDILSSLNNFIHPYNSYSKLSLRMNTFGKMEILVQKKYTEEEIELVNKKVDEIYGGLIRDEMSVDEKIKTIHDYIIQNSSYDQIKADSIINDMDTNGSPYKSESAYGVLLQGYGICVGFSDAMELFLIKMQIPSYKISTETHMWNLVYTNNKWKHLDLTWDNPVTNSGSKFLFHDFFLVDTATLKTLDTGHHTFDETMYKEAL